VCLFFEFYSIESTCKVKRDKYTRNGSAPLPVLQPKSSNLYLDSHCHLVTSLPDRKMTKGPTNHSTFVVDGDQRRKRRVVITNIATAPTAICIPSVTDVGMLYRGCL